MRRIKGVSRGTNRGSNGKKNRQTVRNGRQVAGAQRPQSHSLAMWRGCHSLFGDSWLDEGPSRYRASDLVLRGGHELVGILVLVVFRSRQVAIGRILAQETKTRIDRTQGE